MVLHCRLLFALVGILLLHFALLMLEHFDVLTVAIEIVMGLFHQIVVHYEVIHILGVLVVQTFLVLGLLADVVVRRLKVLESGDVGAVVGIIMVLKPVVLGILSLLDPLTTLGPVGRMPQ